MAKIEVAAPDSRYEIVIKAGLLQNLGYWLHRAGVDGRVIVVGDTHTTALYGEAIAAQLPDASSLTMPAGEVHKNLASAAELYARLAEAGADRQTTILAAGGGVVGDTVGFVASTYMRGVRFVQVPTSLLAMVDSSVGGKVGVDLPEGKNLVGAFKQPDAVLIDVQTLASLPPAEWRCGMAEVIKHGLLADPGLLDLVHVGPERAEELITRAVQVKVDIVQADPYEKGVRAHLNLGHTFAHAIERVTHYGWSHGDAVGVGLLAAARLSAALHLCDESLIDYVDGILAEIGLPRDLQGLSATELYAAMGTDKKWQAGRSRFVLLSSPGTPLIQDDVPREIVLQVLREMQAE